MGLDHSKWEHTREIETILTNLDTTKVPTFTLYDTHHSFDIQNKRMTSRESHSKYLSIDAHIWNFGIQKFGMSP